MLNAKSVVAVTKNLSTQRFMVINHIGVSILFRIFYSVELNVQEEAIYMDFRRIKD
jgi:hypothetical protein